MARPKNNPEPLRSRRPRATTPEQRERQLIAMATDLVEQRMRRGTATSQEIIHYLKLSSSTHELEIEKLKNENKLLNAKVESLDSMKRVEEVYTNALKAMRAYSGQDVPEETYDD